MFYYLESSVSLYKLSSSVVVNELFLSLLFVLNEKQSLLQINRHLFRNLKQIMYLPSIIFFRNSIVETCMVSVNILVDNTYINFQYQERESIFLFRITPTLAMVCLPRSKLFSILQATPQSFCQRAALHKTGSCDRFSHLSRFLQHLAASHLSFASCLL